MERRGMVEPAWRLSAWCRLREPHELSVARRSALVSGWNQWNGAAHGL